MPASADISQNSDSERPTKLATNSTKHSTFTHFPKDRDCDVCLRTKMTRAPCRRRTGEALPRAEKFGDLITANHKVLNEECESRNNHRYAVLVQDPATQWIQSCSCKTKTSQETEKSLRKFLEPTEKPKVFCTDNSLELGKSCGDLSWNHRTSTPHGSETNGIAERAVRRIKEGTSPVLLQSGSDERWWADSGMPFLFSNCPGPPGRWEKEDSENHSKGPIIPFGSLVEYHPISTRDQLRIHQFTKKVFPGIFLWYASIAERLWKGCSVEELEKMDASEIYPRRINAKEIMIRQKG